MEIARGCGRYPENSGMQLFKAGKGRPFLVVHKELHKNATFHGVRRGKYPFFT